MTLIFTKGKFQEAVDAETLISWQQLPGIRISSNIPDYSNSFQSLRTIPLDNV
jgi:hypothetical protein